MYKKNPIPKTSQTHNESYIGESIERKVERIVTNNEPIKDGAPLIFTDRKDGVGAEYDPRTDRFEIAVEAMDKVTASHAAKRTMYAVKDNPSNDGGAEPIQASPTATGEA